MDPGVRRDDADRWSKKKWLARRAERKRSSRPLLLRIGKEQLLAIDPVAGDRGLAFH